MDRLTGWEDEHTRTFVEKAYDEISGFDRAVDLNMILNRLAAYEDTGLTPEETEDIAKAKADGRCVVLPCKPNERWIDEQGEIVVIKIVTDWTGTYVHYRYKGKREVCCCNPTYFAIHFTREEPEAALRKEAGR